jgi:hypothetical protein
MFPEDTGPRLREFIELFEIIGEAERKIYKEEPWRVIAILEGEAV